jgi:hypothetical protein
MVIRMSQNTQVAETALATVCPENSAIRAQSHGSNSIEHRQVARSETSETSEYRVRCTAVLAALLSIVTLSVGCNVYDPSLLESDPLASGGTSGGSILVGNGATHAGGSVGSFAGDDGYAGGMNSAGASNGAAGGGVPSSAGSAGGSAQSGGGSGGSPASGDAGAGVAGGSSGGAGSVTLSMIDDMETPDAYILTADMRQGYWSLSNDQTVGGKQTPSPTMIMSAIPGGRMGSVNGLHTTASGFTTSGALVGVDLNRKGAAASARLTYDASAYKAVHFWAKVEASSPGVIRFAMLDQHTDPGGGKCCPAKEACGTGNIANGLCYDHFNKDLTFTHDWAEYTVAFPDLNQVGWGDNKVDAVDAAHVFGMQLSWTSATMDLWLDDVAFVKK